MKKCRIDFVRLEDALYAAKTQGSVIRSTGLDDNESIHYFNGKFYYEDGCYLGCSVGEVNELFQSFAWVSRANWYSEYYFTDEDTQFLRSIHLYKAMGSFESKFAEYVEEHLQDLDGSEVC